MIKVVNKIIFLTLLLNTSNLIAAEDTRQFVKLPEMMQNHMMSNMRDHLAAIDEAQSLMA